MKTKKFNFIKVLVVLVISSLVLPACHNSYYKANHINKKRFGGEKKEMADAMVEFNDYVMLMEDLSTLGMKKSLLKQTYQKSEKLHNSFEDLKEHLDIQSSIRRVVLPDELSDFHDDYFRQVREADQDTFDGVYKELSLRKMYELEALLVINIEDPVNDLTLDISQDMLDDVKSSISLFEK